MDGLPPLLEPPILHGRPQLLPGVHVELVVDVIEVGLYCGGSDAQYHTDLVIGVSHAEQRQHFPLAPGERIPAAFEIAFPERLGSPDAGKVTQELFLAPSLVARIFMQHKRHFFIEGEDKLLLPFFLLEEFAQALRQEEHAEDYKRPSELASMIER